MSVADQERYRAFAKRYIVDFNGKDAAIECGYSPRSAHNQASRLLRRDDVRAMIGEEIEARNARTEWDADMVKIRLEKILTADIADIVDENGIFKPIREWPMIWRTGLVAGIDVQEINSGDGEGGRVIKAKVIDRLRSLELLGKHVNVNAFRDQLDVKVGDLDAKLDAANERLSRAQKQSRGESH